MSESGIRIAFKSTGEDSQLRLIAQMGASDVVLDLPESIHGQLWTLEGLTAMRRQAETHGLRLSVLEGLGPPPSNRIRLGLEGRDEDLEIYCANIKNMGAAGIPVLCYNWIPVFNWMRTAFDIPTRAGALATGYDHEIMMQQPLTEFGEVSEKRLWEALEYFLRAVIPVAEEAGVKLAMHPSDPPISPIRGLSQIMTCPSHFQRLLDFDPSPANGITFCQGCFSEMGEDVPACIRRFGAQKKIFFVHFRDVQGSREKFVETFHDVGQTDMYEAMKAYYDIAFDGPMRPDHAPTMEGESNSSPGYAVMGRLFAVGYMKGLMEGIEKLPR
jgi:mannonate dehydratase